MLIPVALQGVAHDPVDVALEDVWFRCDAAGQLRLLTVLSRASMVLCLDEGGNSTRNAVLERAGMLQGVYRHAAGGEVVGTAESGVEVADEPAPLQAES